MTRLSSVAVFALGLVALTGCQGEPERLCDRVRFAWPSLNFSVDSDENPSEPGIQVSFTVRSDLAEGREGRLYLRLDGEEEQSFVDTVVTDADGNFSVDSLTLPQGRLVVILEARDECRAYRTGRRLFVWDGEGIPHCSLSFPGAPSQSPGHIPLLGPEHDSNESLTGIQMQAVIDAGRSDATIQLFQVNRDTGAEEVFELSPDSEGQVSQELSFAPGENSVRALCHWEPEDLHPSSANYQFDVVAE